MQSGDLIRIQLSGNKRNCGLRLHKVRSPRHRLMDRQVGELLHNVRRSVKETQVFRANDSGFLRISLQISVNKGMPKSAYYRLRIPVEYPNYR